MYGEAEIRRRFRKKHSTMTLLRKILIKLTTMEIEVSITIGTDSTSSRNPGRSAKVLFSAANVVLISVNDELIFMEFMAACIVLWDIDSAS